MVAPKMEAPAAKVEPVAPIAEASHVGAASPRTQVINGAAAPQKPSETEITLNRLLAQTESPAQAAPKAEMVPAAAPVARPVAEAAPEPPVPASAIAVAAEFAAEPLPKPVVLADRSAIAKADASAVAPAGSDGVRTLEDTVAELLRPMLRQWLDQNMPRIVEKALRVEMAESAKSKPAGTKQH